MISRYKVKDSIEAIQFTGHNHSDCLDFIGKENVDNTLDYPNVKTVMGTARVNTGDYITKDKLGRLFPFSAQLFESSYEKI